MKRTLLPGAVATATCRRASSFARSPWTFGMPSADLGCMWSLTTNATAIRTAANGHKAYGTRRLGESST
jgi:hypothetical protein